MNHPQPSILKSLRHLIPQRRCHFNEALTIAERQAARLNQLLATLDPHFTVTGITDHHLSALPRIRIAREALPVSGMTHWNGKEWIVCLNSADPLPRQRFTLLHEFKHIIDHGSTSYLYQNTRASSDHEQAERAADYFAGCALVPRTALKTAWANGLQTPRALAEHFGVSEAAIRVRLDQTGINRTHDPEPPTKQARCQRPIWTPRWSPQRFIVRQPHYQRSYT